MNKITVICFNCEHEWDADKLSANSDCPKCGCPNKKDSNIEVTGADHIIRIEGKGRETNA